VKMASKQQYAGMVQAGDGLKMVVGHQNQQMKLRLRFIDTPGLDDSDGGDDEFMAEVLQKMSAQGDADLLAFVFVTRVGAVWSGGFLEAAKRYWEQFPDLRSNWIFLHTAMNPYQDEDYKSGQNYEEACVMRKAALTNELARAFGGSAGNVALLQQCQHIFIENEGLINSTRRMNPGSEKYAVQQLQLMERAKSVNRLLQAMQSNSPASMKDIPFLKSREIREKDNELMGRIEGIKEGVKTALRIAADRLSANVAENTRLSQEKTNLKSAKEKSQSRLAEIDKDGYVCLRRKYVEYQGSWAFWAGWHVTEEVCCAYNRPDDICRSAMQSANYTNGSYVDSPLVSEGNQIMWKPIVQSSIWSGVAYTFKLEVSFKNFHRDEIQTCKKEVDDLQQRIRDVDREQAQFKGQNTKDQAMIDVLNRQTDVLDDLKRDLKADKKSVKAWSRPGGYREFYHWLGLVKHSDTPVPEILVRYGGVMQLEREALDALVANYTPPKDGKPPTVQEILEKDVFEKVDDGIDDDVISDTEVLDEPVKVEPYADLHEHALVQTPESCPSCGTRKSVFQCAVGCPFAVCFSCSATLGLRIEAKCKD